MMGKPKAIADCVGGQNAVRIRYAAPFAGKLREQTLWTPMPDGETAERLAEAITSALEQARREALEEAVEVVQSWIEENALSQPLDDADYTLSQVADEIHALKHKGDDDA